MRPIGSHPLVEALATLFRRNVRVGERSVRVLRYVVPKEKRYGIYKRGKMSGRVSMSENIVSVPYAITRRTYPLRSTLASLLIHGACAKKPVAHKAPSDQPTSTMPPEFLLDARGSISRVTRSER